MILATYNEADLNHFRPSLTCPLHAASVHGWLTLVKRLSWGTLLWVSSAVGEIYVQTAIFVISTLIQCAQNVPTCESPIYKGESSTSGWKGAHCQVLEVCRYAQGRCIGHNKIGGAPPLCETPTSATKGDCKTFRLGIGARAASRIEVPCQRDRIGTSVLRLVCALDTAPCQFDLFAGLATGRAVGGVASAAA